MDLYGRACVESTRPGWTERPLPRKDFEGKHEIGQLLKWFQNYPWREMLGVIQLGLTVEGRLLHVSNKVKVFLAIPLCYYRNSFSRFGLLMFSLSFLPIFPQNVALQTGVALEKYPLPFKAIYFQRH